MGIILFSIWPFLKFILIESVAPMDLIDDSLADIPHIRTILYTIVFILFLLNLVVHIYIGRSAIGEGRGHYKKSYTYIIITIILAIVNTAMIIKSIPTMLEGSDHSYEITNLFVDLTLCWIMIQIIVSAMGLRKLDTRLFKTPQ